MWLFEGDHISYHLLFSNIYENPVNDKINSFIPKLVPKMWIKWATSSLPGNVWILLSNCYPNGRRVCDLLYQGEKFLFISSGSKD